MKKSDKIQIKIKNNNKKKLLINYNILYKYRIYYLYKLNQW